MDEIYTTIKIKVLYTNNKTNFTSHLIIDYPLHLALCKPHDLLLSQISEHIQKHILLNNPNYEFHDYQVL